MKRMITAAACFTCAATLFSQNRADGKLPNIVFILADDLGYGDLSCYGQKKFTTPNIDRIAGQGMLFRNHYTGCTVSAPSRSSLMTGLHTGHTPIRGNREMKPEGQWPLPAESITIAEILKSRGYITGAFGKWGLGFVGSDGDPNKQGFDEFFGYNCQALAHNYYPDHLWHNNERIDLQLNENGSKGSYSPQLIQEAALSFLRNNSKKPFFLFYPTTIPHAELTASEKYMSRFRGLYLPEKLFKGTDSGPTFRKGPYTSQNECHAAFAAMVTQLDDYVGELISELGKLGLEDNTIIIFASDNGPHLEGGADPDYFDSNGPLRGYKRDLYEGGISTPLLIKWPGVIKAGSDSPLISAFWDFLPTFAEITGATVPKNTDGISLLPTLLGQKQKEHAYLYWEFHEQGGRMALRKGDWKLIENNVDEPGAKVIELYNLATDRAETVNLASERTDIVKKLESIMLKAHLKSEIFPFKFETISE